MKLSDYQKTTTDWRAQIRRNEVRTRCVLALFIGLYLLLGFLIDVFIYSQQYYLVPYSTIAWGLLTLQVIPKATLITGAIAVISIFITYAMHDKIMLLGTTAKEVTRDSTDAIERQLYNTIEEMKVAAGLAFMPKVYIIDANYMNAFASGYSEKSAMVAITRGLLNKLDRSELQAVMAHELSHIRHHDIKLMLMVAVLSNLMLIVVDIMFYSVLFGGRRRQDNRLVVLILLLRYLLPVVTMLLGLFLSRTREYMADSGAVQLMRDNEPMARALLKIEQDYQQNAKKYQQKVQHTAHEELRQAAYIYDPSKLGLSPVKAATSWFATHPSTSDRLKALGFRSRPR